MTFNKAVKVILNHEGGYVNDQDDPGGETKYGIAKRFHKGVDIKNLTEEQAAQIYFSKYWLPMKCEAFTNDLLKLHLFDCAVNCGINPAIILLQKVLGVEVDGIIGYQTTSTANNYPNQKQLVEKYIAARKEYYTELVKRSPKRKKYFKGWINRVNSTKY